MQSTVRLLLATLLSLVCFSLALSDIDLSLHWLIRASWFSAVLLFLSWCIDRETVKRFFNVESPGDLVIIGTIAVLAVATRFLWLEDLPFFSTGDSNRDGGILAYDIYRGQIKNIFEWGSYQGYGLILPYFCSFVYALVGPSVLTYRIPGAAVSVLDVLLLYFLVRKAFGSLPGAVAAVTLLFNPYHIFFGRTELAVGLDSLWTTVLFAALLFFFHRRDVRSFAVFSIASGLGLQLHAPVRPVVGFVFLVAAGVVINDLIRRRKTAGDALRLFVLYPAGVILGYGPMIIFESLSSLIVAGDRIPLLSTADRSAAILGVIGRYWESLLVYVSEPAASVHSMFAQPLLSPPLAFLAVLGLVVAATQRRSGLAIPAVAGFFLFPLTNSAITDGISNDHRLMPLHICAAILVGASFLLPQLIRWRGGAMRSRFVVLLLLGILTWGAVISTVQSLRSNGYSVSTWNRSEANEEYLLGYAIREVESSAELLRYPILWIRGANSTLEIIRRQHNMEQFQYRLPTTEIRFETIPAAGRNELFIGVRPEFDSTAFTRKEICREYAQFACPPTKETLRIYIERVPAL